MARRWNRSLAAFFFLLALSVSSFAGNAKGNSYDQEFHLKDPNASTLYSNSVFMHGYIHGYEQGFHNADLDLQMGHGFRDVNTLDDYKKIAGYHASFGDKSVFRRGYRQGFRVGYTDGIAGRTFRAIHVLRAASTGLRLNAMSSGRQALFDSGVQQGYQAGQNEGLHDGRLASSFKNVAPGCTVPDQNGKNADYCEGFRRAFLIGYSDGYTNQQDNPRVAVK